jgi:hypothetical protein
MSEEEVPHINLDFRDLYPEIQKTYGPTGLVGSPGVMGWPGIRESAEYHLKIIESIRDVLDILGNREEVIDYSQKSAGISSWEDDVQKALAYLGTDYTTKESWNLLEESFLKTLVDKLKMKVTSEKFGL